METLSTFRYPDTDNVVASCLLVLICIHDFFLLSASWSYPFNISVIIAHLIPSHPLWEVTLSMAPSFVFYVLTICISLGLFLFHIVASFKVSNSFPWVSFFSTRLPLKVIYIFCYHFVFSYSFREIHCFSGSASLKLIIHHSMVIVFIFGHLYLIILKVLLAQHF